MITTFAYVLSFDCIFGFFYEIGRLKITTENGRLSDGTFEKLFAFGGRGFSVWRTDTMSRIYDTGSDVEDTHANARPDLFNAQSESETVIKETVDSRSDNKVLISFTLIDVYMAYLRTNFLRIDQPENVLYFGL
jgi:hypothetical protein